MTVYNGKGGGFAFAGSVVFNEDTNSWEIATSSDVADSTGMGDTWEERLPGLTDFTASVDGNADSASDYTAAIGSGGAVTASIAASGPKLSGGAICTSITETVGIDDIGKVSASFEGNDAAGLILAASGGSSGTTTGGKFHGKSATALFDVNTFPNIVNWSYTLNAGTADSTGMNATNSGRTRTSGFKSGTASVSTYQDSAQNATIGQQAELTLKRNSSVVACTGPAICTNISNGTDKAGNATADYSFEFTGTVDKTV